MNIKKPILLLLILGSSCAFANVQINKVIVGPQGKDPKNKFSITLELNNTGKSINNWQIGFYMPRLFRTTSISNTKLNMQICEIKQKNNCSKLIYAQNKFTESDLSSGFTTVLRPETKFPLNAHQKYIIKLTHNSSRGSKNYSSLPQSFFLIENGKVINLPTNKNHYTITSYDATKTNQQVAEHIAKEWESSNDVTPIINVIPTPQKVTLSDNKLNYTIPEHIEIHNSVSIPNNEIHLWKQAITHDLHENISMDAKSSNNGINLIHVSTTEISNPEGYDIQITSKSITIKASNNAGFFYALQTLRQLWFKEKHIPEMTIIDYPRFKYRGLMLDVARHFTTKDEIKQVINLMAANKLNTLHLHLSDDEAFRLELDNHPELSQIGAKRGFEHAIGPKAMIQNNLSKSDLKHNMATVTEHGYYSKQDIRELIKYANERQITIIPEIDIPGHSRALMKALPSAFYESDDLSEYSGYGDNSLPVCAYKNNSAFGKKFTTTIDSILLQTTELFNNQSTVYAINNELGVGGDEVAKHTWDKSPLCNQYLEWRDLNSLSKEHHFLSKIKVEPEFKNVLFSGWHEFILNHDDTIGKHAVSAKDTAHIWVWGNYKSSKNKAVSLIKARYPVVLAYSDSLYFDMPYTAKINEPGLYWATQYGDTYAALQSSIYANKTIESNVNANNILGLEAAAWADVIPDFTQLQYMIAPKIAGLAEASWSSSQVTSKDGMPDWHSLAERLGCNNNKYLGYIHKIYDIKYRGYPNGIALEAPELCDKK